MTTTPRESDHLGKVIETAPALLWWLLAVFLIWRLWKPFRTEILPRLKVLKGFGLEMEFAEAREELTAAAAKYDASAGEIIARLPSVLRRAKTIGKFLSGAQLLWVDDHPENNLFEIRAFRSLGVAVDIVTSTPAAESVLHSFGARYDLILSDLGRANDPEAGLRLIPVLKEFHLRTPLIIYTGDASAWRGMPPEVFALTSRPDELFHSVFDALERCPT